MNAAKITKQIMASLGYTNKSEITFDDVYDWAEEYGLPDLTPAFLGLSDEFDFAA